MLCCIIECYLIWCCVKTFWLRAVGNTYNTWDASRHGLRDLDHLPQWLGSARQWGPRSENFRIRGQNLLFETSALHRCLFAFRRHGKVCQHSWGLEWLGGLTILYLWNRTSGNWCRQVLQNINIITHYYTLVAIITPCSHYWEMNTFGKVYTVHFIIWHHGKSCSIIHASHCLVRYIRWAKSYLQRQYTGVITTPYHIKLSDRKCEVLTLLSISSSSFTAASERLCLVANE